MGSDDRGSDDDPKRSEVRQYLRAPVELPIVLSDATNRVQALIQFSTQDISVGGAFVCSDLLFEIGEELNLAFGLPDGRQVQARGRVVRVARDTGGEVVPGMGIAFVDLSPADRDAIRQLVIRGSHG